MLLVESLRRNRMQIFVAVLFVAIASATSQPPVPTPALKSTKPQKPTTNSQEQSTANERGTDKSPVFVRVLPATKTQEEAADDKAKDLDQSSANWWMVRLTGGVVFIGLIQTFVFWLQAVRLKQSIEKMDAIAAGQTDDIRASIGQATRSAAAMEQMAVSLSAQVGQMKTGLDLTRQSADAATHSAETAERALMATQRALIVNTEINVNIVIDDTSRQLVGFQISPVFKNSGPTMALNVRCSATFIGQFRDINDISHSAPIASESTTMSIGPGVAFSANNPTAIGLDQLEPLKRDQAAFFIHGYIEYRDVFENTPLRVTYVCARIMLRDDPTIRVGDGFNTKAFYFMGGPSDHNCTT
jgi:hypothetical protein